MADDQDPVETTEHGNPRPPKPEPTRDAAGDDLEGKSPEEIAAELKRTRDSLKKANKEAADRRRRLEELEAAERQREEAQLSEDERQRKEREREREEARTARTRAADLEAENRRLKVAHTVYIEAADRGFEYPQDVHKLIDPDAIDVDETTGEIVAKSVRDAVDRLAKSRPGLLRARIGGGTPPREIGRRPLGEGGTPPTALHGRGTDPGMQELESTGRYGGRM